MKRYFILFLLAIFVFGCKKNKDSKMTIVGNVSDNGNGNAVAGSVIKLYYKPYQNGVFMTTYSFLTSTTTDASGNYTFLTEKPATSDFKFVVETSNYFNTEKVINPDNLSLKEDNTINFKADASGSLLIHLKNNTPYDTNDYFQFQTLGLNYSCSTCCSSSPIVKIGNVVDTSFTCMRYANRFINFTWFKTKNGITTLKNDSVYCGQGIVTNLDVFY